MDYDRREIIDARRNIPFSNLSVGDIRALPFFDNFADVVVCSEVLEHIADPRQAISEIHRVTRKYAILSVPREPLWRILNLLRFKYVKHVGNTPGHVNHWNAVNFGKFVGEYFHIVEMRFPLPWTIALGKKKQIRKP